MCEIAPDGGGAQVAPPLFFTGGVNMTIADARKIVMYLLDEDSDEDFKGKVNSYFDIAQKQIATTVDFIQKQTQYSKAGTYPLPDDFFKIKRVEGTDFEIIGGSIKVSGPVTVWYFAYPSDIDESSSDDTEFEISVIGQSAIPYFAAAQLVITDTDMRPYYAFSDRYNNILQNITLSKNGNVKVVSFN